MTKPISALLRRLDGILHVRALRQRLGRIFHVRTIRRKITLAFCLMAGGMLLLNLFMIASLRSFSQQYHEVAARIAAANHLVPPAREGIGTEAYYLAVGRDTLTTSGLIPMCLEVRRGLNRLETQTVDTDGKRALRVAGRVMNTLDKYAAQLAKQVATDAPLTARNHTLEEIRSVSALLYEQINLYIYAELDYFELLDHRIQQSVGHMALVNLAALGGLALLLVVSLYIISSRITRPIDALVRTTWKLARGDFGVHVDSESGDEIAVLNSSFNSMAAHLQTLLDTVREDAVQREKLELRLMQEQINPHFLYNTLETIVWLAESGEKQTVIDLVQSLSRFFRTVLSEGRDVVTVRQELSCIGSYLFIQRVRYGDIMDYEIDADETVMNCLIQKLTLQPLVENALYHGIKNKRGGGSIHIGVRREGEALLLTVMDTGCGMTADKLAALRASVSQTEKTGDSFGLSNLQKRIQLYYGPAWGMEIASAPQMGTTVTLRVRAQEN